jgi:hypothetical protein
MNNFATKPQGGNQLHVIGSSLRNLTIAQPVSLYGILIFITKAHS